MIIVRQLLNNATATGEGSWMDTGGIDSDRAYSFVVNGTGAVAATVEVYVSNDNGVTAYLFATETLSGTTQAKNAFPRTAAYPHTMAKITSISGTGAAVDVRVLGHAR